MKLRDTVLLIFLYISLLNGCSMNLLIRNHGMCRCHRKWVDFLIYDHPLLFTWIVRKRLWLVYRFISNTLLLEDGSETSSSNGSSSGSTTNCSVSTSTRSEYDWEAHTEGPLVGSYSGTFFDSSTLMLYFFVILIRSKAWPFLILSKQLLRSVLNSNYTF